MAEPPPLFAMSTYALTLIGAVLVHNFVLVQFLGLCPFLGVSDRADASLGLGLATTFVLTLTSVLCWCVDHWLLQPLGLEFLRTLAFILSIAAVVQFVELAMRHSAPTLFRVLGLYLPLITSNCIVLGVALLASRQADGFIDALLRGFGAGVGFALVLLAFSGLRERLEGAAVPAGFRGAPIALVTAGIMAMAFMGFAGLDR